MQEEDDEELAYFNWIRQNIEGRRSNRYFIDFLFVALMDVNFFKFAVKKLKEEYDNS